MALQVNRELASQHPLVNDMTLDAFVSEVRHAGLATHTSVERWTRSTHPSQSMVHLRSADTHSLAYIKLRQSQRGFWGLNPNQLRRLHDSRLPWSVLLLHGLDGSGYFLTSALVSSALGDLWKPGHDTEFKVNENAVVGIAHPQSRQHLITQLLATVEQPS